MNRILLALALLTSLGGCATKAAAPAPLGMAAPVSADRGRFFVLRSCAGCHAVGTLGESPNGGAPSFPTIALRHNSLSLERLLARISKEGHFEMPPIYMTPDEIRDITAYIETINVPTAAAASTRL